MRKSKVIYILAAVGVAAAVGIFGVLDGRDDVVRYHQHLSQPSEAELGLCEICGGDSELCTHLPIISIDTGGQKVPGKPITDAEGKITGYETSDAGETQITVSLKTYEKEGVYHHLEDAPDQTATALFRVRGNSSRRFDKSNYKLKLVDEKHPEQNVSLGLLGMEPGDEWSLHGPFLDKTLMRNYMWMNLSAQVMGYAPNVRFCEVVLDGEYMGVYVLMEMIDVAEGRVDLTQYRQGDPVFSYIVRFEPDGDPVKQLENFTFYTTRLEPGVQAELVYPGRQNQTEAVKTYVERDFNDIEHRLYSYEMRKDPDSCWDYLDLDSFVDYYILQEFLAVNDVFSASTYFYKDVRGKLHIGPVWDYNNVLNNFFRDLSDPGFLLSQRGWYGQLMKSERFVERVIYRYRQLRQGVLSEDNIEQYARDVQQWLGSAVDRNFERWGYSFDASLLDRHERRNPSSYGNSASMTLEELNPSSYGEAMDWMLSYARERGQWLDVNIETLRQYCHPSKNANEKLD